MRFCTGSTKKAYVIYWTPKGSDTYWLTALVLTVTALYAHMLTRKQVHTPTG